VLLSEGDSPDNYYAISVCSDFPGLLCFPALNVAEIDRKQDAAQRLALQIAAEKKEVYSEAILGSVIKFSLNELPIILDQYFICTIYFVYL
jgi:hypothetical protein